MKKIAIIMGSSRSVGNTRVVVDEFLKVNPSAVVFDLNNYQIGYYDYEFKNSDDDFFGLYKELLQYETWLFATPIYWYTMSAQMKTFLDRISDMLEGEYKPFGRLLKGKHLAVISCGSDAEIFDGFEMPFRESATYLNMNYKGHLHAWLDHNNQVPIHLIDRFSSFII